MHPLCRVCRYIPMKIIILEFGANMSVSDNAKHVSSCQSFKNFDVISQNNHICKETFHIFLISAISLPQGSCDPCMQPNIKKSFFNSKLPRRMDAIQGKVLLPLHCELGRFPRGLWLLRNTERHPVFTQQCGGEEIHRN